MPRRGVTFKTAAEPWEFEQVHALNYRTFVEEIPQHPPNRERRLVDRFHIENQYLIGLAGQHVVGMVAVRDQRPFSLDAKLERLDDYLPGHQSMCELRLLAVDPAYRQPRVFQGLMLILAEHCERHGYDLAVMSGTTRQLKLYGQLGFVPFGPLVGASDAQFQPMYLTQAAYRHLLNHCRALRRPDIAQSPLPSVPDGERSEAA
jgi:ribosomal protein S18 acetylase RimI-like enzyme